MKCSGVATPEEVLCSRWLVMELGGSVGSDMTACQTLMQPHIWRLLAASLQASWQGILSPRPPDTTQGDRQEWGPKLVFLETEDKNIYHTSLCIKTHDNSHKITALVIIAIKQKTVFVFFIVKKQLHNVKLKKIPSL